MASDHAHATDMKQLTDLVSGEIDRQLRNQNDAMDLMKTQMAKVLKEFEDMTWDMTAKRSWMKSMSKSRDLQATHPSTMGVHPVITSGNIAPPSVSPSRLPKLATTSPKRKHVPMDPEKRSPDGKLLFDKKLPRVANMERSDGYQLVMAAQQKQLMYERALVRYPQCRSNVFAPSAYDDSVTLSEAVQGSSVPPMTSLTLEFAYGVHNGTPSSLSQTTATTTNTGNSSNLQYVASGEVLWFTAALVVLYAPETNDQRYFRGHTNEVTSVALHPNQEIVASGQAGRETWLLVWDSSDPELGKRVVCLKGHSIAVRSISFSHDGKLVASLGGDMYNTICIHDWKEQSLLVTARGHSFRVNTIAFNPYQAYGRPESKRKKKPGQALHDDDVCYTLVSCGVRHIRFWTLTKTEYVPPLTEENEQSAFAKSTFGAPSPVRPPAPHEKMWKLEGNVPSFSGRFEVQDFTCLTFIDDSGPLYVYDEHAKELVATAESDHSLGRIVAGTAKGDLCVFWQPRKGQYRDMVPEKDWDKEPAKWWEIPDEYTDEDINELILEKIAFEPTARLVELVPHDQETGTRFKITTQAQQEIDAIGKRLVVKPHSAALHARLEELKYNGPTAHHGMAYQVAYCKKNRLVASSGADGRIVLWKCQMTTPVRVPGISTLGVFTSLRGSLSEGTHALVPIDEQTKVFVLPTTLPGESGPQDDAAVVPRPTSLTWRDDGKRLLIGTSTNCVWELNVVSSEWKCLFEARSGAMVACVSHPAKEEAATVSLDGYLSIWDLRRHVCKRRLSLLAEGINLSASRATCMEFHPFGDEIVIGFQNGEFIVVSYQDLRVCRRKRTKAQDQSAPPSAITIGISAIKYCPKGQLLAVGARDTFIYIYDAVNQFKKLCVCEGHTSGISHVTWNENGDILQSNTIDGEILHWSITTGPKATVRQITDAFAVRDVAWSKWSCVFGWPTPGIWPEDVLTLGDIAAVCRSISSDYQEPVLAVANRSVLRLFKWPALTKNAKSKNYAAHSSAIATVCFSFNDRYVLTVGGDDGTLIQWRCVRPEESTGGAAAAGRRSKFRLSGMDDGGRSSPVPPPVPPVAEKAQRSPLVLRNTREVIASEPEDEYRAAEVAQRASEDPEEQELVDQADNVAYLGQFQALHDFEPENSDELNLRAGELVRVLAEANDDWYVGESCDGTRGIFPKNYVVEYTEPSSHA